MTRYAELYWHFLIQRLKTLMEYRANFIIGASSTVILQASSLLTIWVVMRQVPSLNGWSYDEVLLIYGLVTLAKSINHMFADNLWTVGRDYIRSGGFDRFLVGAVLVAKSATALGIALNPQNLLYVLMAALSGGAIFIALNLITCVSAF